MKRLPLDFTVPWDAQSDQPHRILDRHLRRRLRLSCLPAYLDTLATAGLVLPLAALRSLRLTGVFHPPVSDLREAIGVGISPRPDRAVHDLVDDLGVRHLALRIGRWQHQDLSRHLAAIASFAPRPVLLVLMQDRRAIVQPESWRAFVAAVAAELPANVQAVQLGQAVNRLKWGCVHPAEAAVLTEAVGWLKDRHPSLLILGPSIIDFEPLAAVGAWFQPSRRRLDGLTLSLYVDRRGDPKSRQGGCFDLPAKIRAFASLAALVPRCSRRVWITEFNWPLAGHGAWAPTSPKECVDEVTAGRFTGEYVRLALATGLVERLYHWQLIARGYGLVDDSGSGLRRRPAYAMLRDLLSRSIPPSG